MISSIQESPLFPIANPGSIAFFGASNKPTTMGTIQFMSMKQLGFEERIYPIHPQEKKVLGYRAYKSVADLPEVPDLAILVLPTRIVSQTIDECGRKGIKHAVVISGGFKEVGKEGALLEEELKKMADRHGLRFVDERVSAQSENILKLRKSSGKPMVGYTYGFSSDPLLQKLIMGGVPVFPSPERAAAAIKALTAYYEKDF